MNDIAQPNLEEAFNEVKKYFTAEYWAKYFTKQISEKEITPIQNFKLNIFKSRILIASAQEISKIWPEIHQRLIEGKERYDKNDPQAYFKAFSDLCGTGFVTYLVYTEQALVTAVSATEVYFKDRLAHSIQKDPRMLKQYLNRNISVERIFDAGLDLSNDIGTLIVENENFQNIDNIKGEYEKIFGQDFFKEINLDKIKEIFSIRHVIVHKAGIIDNSFITETGLDYEVGDRFCFKRDEILEMIDYIDKIITVIELKLNSKLTLEDFL